LSEALPVPSLPETGLASLGSGSRGNGTLVRLGGELLLVDCGFNLKRAEQRLARLGLRPGDLTAILVTHEHSDHIGGVAALAQRYGVPVWCSYGTQRAARGALAARCFLSDRPFTIGDVQVRPVTVPHDAREPTQFVFEQGGTRLGVLSDLGCVTPHVIEQFQALDALLLEANHDRRMLMNGRYPASVKRRVASDQGHLSNEQSEALLQQLQHPALKLVLGHISLENNDLALLRRLFEPYRPRLAALGYAAQDAGHDWIGIDTG
jgi:phosphoribosyl 1,2-cyclic phosphodiesterase